jgi:hypothetical protein
MKENANPTIYPVERKKRVRARASPTTLPAFTMMSGRPPSSATPPFLNHTTNKPPPPPPLQEEAAADMLLLEDEDEEARDAFTAEEVFELIRNLNDPEHPLTLEQLKVATVRACLR